MPDWLTGLLIELAIFVVGIWILIAVVRRIVRAAGRGGRGALAALSTGGLSLVTEEPHTAAEAHRAAKPKTRAEYVVSALATGGVSLLFADLPTGEGSDRGTPEAAA